MTIKAMKAILDKKTLGHTRRMTRLEFGKELR